MKQFLKPDWRKIILFLLLLYFIHHFAFIEDIGRSYPLNELFETNGKFIALPGGCYRTELNPIFWLPMNIIIIMSAEEYEECGGPNIAVFLIAFIYWLFLSYFISCSIFTLYDKSKNRLG